MRKADGKNPVPKAGVRIGVKVLQKDAMYGVRTTGVGCVVTSGCRNMVGREEEGMADRMHSVPTGATAGVDDLRFRLVRE